MFELTTLFALMVLTFLRIGVPILVIWLLSKTLRYILPSLA